MSDALTFIATQAIQIPVLLAYFIGFGFAFARRQVLGDAAAFAGVGFGALALARLASLLATAWQMHSYQSGASASELMARVSVVYGAARICELVGVVLLIVGLLRRPEQRAAAPAGFGGS